MGPVEIVSIVGAALVIGCLIGSVGIGGVLLVPFLTLMMGFGLRDAVAIAMASYVATGLVAVLQARLSDDWKELAPFWPLIVATLPGAFLGGLAIAAVPETLAQVALAAFLALTGVWTLGRRKLEATRGDGGRPGWIAGVATGFGSAVTGTGGPAVLIPILIWRAAPLLTAVVVGQIVQLPIAIAATSGNLASGPVDVATALLVAAALVPGVLAGRWAAKRVPLGILRKIVAVLLIATGAWLALRALA